MIVQLSLLLLITLANQAAAVCPGTGYDAPYDLSSTPALLTSQSINFKGTYYIAPCSVVDANLCPYTSGQQTCFSTTTWELVGDGLGTAVNTDWAPLDGDWSKGAVAINTDVSYDYDQCNTASGPSNVKTTYMCSAGDDSMQVLIEPASDKNGACVFEFRIDSSIVCGDKGGGGGGSSSKKGLSGGWIFVILLVVVTSLYLIGGMSWNHFRKQKTGMDLLPNREFWADLPTLVKDGMIYTWVKMRGWCGRKGESSLSGSSTTGNFESI